MRWHCSVSTHFVLHCCTHILDWNHCIHVIYFVYITACVVSSNFGLKSLCCTLFHCCMHPQTILNWSQYAAYVIHIVLVFLCYSKHILKQSSTDISMLHLLFTLFYTILNTSSSNLWQSHYATLIIHFVSHCCMHPQAILDWSWRALYVIHIILHNFKWILKQSLTEAQVLHTCRSPSSHWQSAEVIFNTYCQHWKIEVSNVKRLGQDESGLMLTLSGNRKLLYRWVLPKLYRHWNKWFKKHPLGSVCIYCRPSFIFLHIQKKRVCFLHVWSCHNQNT